MGTQRLRVACLVMLAACAEVSGAPAEEGPPAVDGGDAGLPAAVPPAEVPVATPTQLLWPRGVVPFEIDPSAAPIAETIRGALDALSTRTKVSFVAHRSEADFVVFVAATGPSRSRLGRIGGRQTVELRVPEGSLPINLVMHEVGHALGRIHEHQRPDRDLYVSVRLENLRPISSQEGLEEQFEPVAGDPATFPAYDYDSIMHYDSFNMAKDAESPVLTKKDGGLIVGYKGAGLSPLDVSVFDAMVAAAGGPPS